jgi:predicted HicB family RNase H-like nuclease
MVTKPARKRREERIGVRVSADLKERLQRCADDDARSVSSWIALALEAAVVEAERKAASKKRA